MQFTASVLTGFLPTVQSKIHQLFTNCQDFLFPSKFSRLLIFWILIHPMWCMLLLFRCQCIAISWLQFTQNNKQPKDEAYLLNYPQTKKSVRKSGQVDERSQKSLTSKVLSWITHFSQTFKGLKMADHFPKTFINWRNPAYMSCCTLFWICVSWFHR